jgi:hypothetical protein
MDAIPELSPKDLSEHLERYYANANLRPKGRIRRTLVAYFGRCEETTVEVTGAGRFHVVPVQSELELRERLPEIDDLGARVAFLLPRPGLVPLDLQGRFAQNGKIFRIGKDARLRRLFGAAEVDPPALESPIANYLVQVPPAAELRSSGGRLTDAAMWREYLSAVWGLDVREGFAGDALLAWAAWNGRGPQFAEAMTSRAAAGVRDALLALLTRELGPAGPLVWQAWEHGQGRALFEWSLVFESLGTSEEPAVRLFTKQALMQHFGVSDEDGALVAAKQLGDWAPTAMRYAETRAGVSPVELRARVTAADRLASTSEIRAVLETSRRLPTGWTRRLERLGHALRDGAARPAAAALEQAAVALKALEGHDFYRDDERRPIAERAEMAVRLLAWVASDPLAALPEPLGPAGDVDLLGRWYAEHGGHVDRARRIARGGGEGPFADGVAAVLAAADALRRQLDRRFARALQAWHAQGRQGSLAIPIDRAVERVAVRFMNEDPSRKLLVLLMDGMGWAQAVELFESMAALIEPWGPIAWHASTASDHSESAVPVVLANLPTLTDVSRAAFFAGKPLPHGNKPTTDKDVERWQQHPALRPFFEGRSAPKLMLRGEGHGAEGNLSSAARELVRDSSQRVVAIVVNAIDASLKADSQQRHRWTVDDVKSLAELLEVAKESGRTVLLCSDHGHVPSDLLKNVGQEAGGARWRPWVSEADPVEDYEIALSGSHVWTPKGAHGVVLLVDDTANYGGVKHAGEHGGASLAEVVAPCVLIGSEDEATRAIADPALGVRDLRVPPFWHYEVPGAAPAVGTPPPRKRPEPRRSAAEKPKSLVLPGLEPQHASAAEPQSPLAHSELFKAQTGDVALRAQIVRVVRCLQLKGGSCSDAALAATIGETPWRIGPFVSRVEEVLNVEGYPVLRYDRAAKQVHLDIELLRQLFEVDL